MLTINAAIERLYITFAAYPLPSYTDPCRCCHTPEDEAKLHARPLRELSASDLNKYAFDALLTWGSEPLFKHLLPRVYDLYFSVPQDPLFAINPEILFSKFRHAKWHQWPANERDAVEALLKAAWFEVLNQPSSSPPFYEDVDAWLCAIAQCVDDISPYLAQWLEIPSLNGAQLLSELLITGGAGSDAFWDHRSEQKEQLLHWQHSEAVIHALTDAQARYGAEHANEFAAALSSARSSEP